MSDDALKEKVGSLLNRYAHVEVEYWRGRCPVGGINGEQEKCFDEILALIRTIPSPRGTK